jgi:branched-subunit amino acid permease
MTGNVVLPAFLGEIVMKTIVSALIALSVLAGVAAPANALDAKAFYEQQDRQSH